MNSVTLSDTEWKQINDYCSLNSITDVNGFCVSCLMKGLSIEKFGASPIEKIKMETPSTIVKKDSSEGIDKKTAKVVRKVRVIKKVVKKDD